ncbi:MAG: rod-binding protein [Deltaproteobacteria bacterium]|nr:rod-binding protein [Deltaproteobacteria bacterium]
MMKIGGAEAISSDGASGKRNIRSGEEERLRKTCADFESIFLYRMIEVMRRTVPAGGVFQSGGAGGDAYRMITDQKIAETLAHKKGGVGLQKMLYEQLKGRMVKGGGEK